MGGIKSGCLFGFALTACAGAVSRGHSRDFLVLVIVTESVCGV